MRVPVLLYHALFDGDLSDENYEISRDEFELHIKYLYDNGYRSLLVDDFFSTDIPGKSEEKCVAITFDDGRSSDYEMAFPVLKRYGFVATFFVTVDWIGRERYVEWSQLKEMNRAGMSIQSHSLSHPFLSDLGEDDLYRELNESRQLIERELNVPVDVLSIPGGFFSRDVLTMARETGYKGVCTSVPGLNRLGSNAGFLKLNRFVMTRRVSFQNFKSIVNMEHGYVAACLAQHYFKSGIKRLLGSKRYYKLWNKYLRKA